MKFYIVYPDNINFPIKHVTGDVEQHLIESILLYKSTWETRSTIKCQRKSFEPDGDGVTTSWIALNLRSGIRVVKRLTGRICVGSEIESARTVNILFTRE